jgi:ribonuclease-3
VDGGYDAAREFILRSLGGVLGTLDEIPNLDNPKGELQEFLQATSPDAPQYEMTYASGPDHDREFECAVFHGGIELGRGRGKSKKEAESQAALLALRKLRDQAADSEAAPR